MPSPFVKFPKSYTLLITQISRDDYTDLADFWISNLFLEISQRIPLKLGFFLL